MAQIRKFTNGGTAEKTKPETWGKIYKNGTPYQVHDDTLRWLEGQGSIGQEMANELRSGVDQHIEIGSDGVGLIKNISTGMENLSYKHRKRLNRKQGLFNGLFESSTVRGTRDIVQGIADMNYEKFSDQRTPFDFGNIDLEYIATPGENGISYSFNSTSNNNAKALQRLNKIISDGKIIIPEGQK